MDGETDGRADAGGILRVRSLFSVQPREVKDADTMRAIEKELRIMADGYEGYEFALTVRNKTTGEYYIMGAGNEEDP